MTSIFNSKIFLVEDDPFSKELYFNHLQEMGFQSVSVFSSGKEFLDNLNQNPDLIFLDYYLDDCKGTELLLKIKEYNPNICVVMLSGQSDMEVTVSLLNNGAFDYIIKGNYAIQKIDEVMAKWVSIYEYNQSVKNIEGASAKRSCIKAIVFAQEKVRKEISDELHDNVSQILGATKLYLEIACKDEKNRYDLLIDSKNLINDAIHQVRNISHSLQSVYFKKVNIEEEINKLVQFLKNQNKFIITTDVQLKGLGEMISTDLQHSVVRILQEQVNNIVKYSNAKNVSISVKNNNNNLLIMVKDDGKGFDMNEVNKGIGLKNIVERIEKFNGIYSINAQENNGCTWNIRIPLTNSLKQLSKAI